VTRWRWLALVVLLAAAVFAWSGGSYSQREYLALRADTLAARVRLDSLVVAVESLAAFRDSLVRDPVFQERLARERLGMIRPGEIMLILEPVGPDTTDR
jgi:cell division protein FtsB